MRSSRAVWVAGVVAGAMLATVALVPAAGELTLPLKPGSVRLAVIGDTGTGDREQYEVAGQMADYHQLFPFTLVLMLGDNLYGSEHPRDYERKFTEPYRPLLDEGVEFYASLGNHDNPNQRFYDWFNMNGRRYYSFTESTGAARFFALDSTYLTEEQIAWLEDELADADEPWKIAFFHHPMYSSGRRHGPDEDLRAAIEPLFIEHGVSAVFAGHEHFYERLMPQHGITYFISGAAAKLRRGNIRGGALTAAGFDRDRSFMLVELAGDELHFQAISRMGETVDSGIVLRRNGD